MKSHEQCRKMGKRLKAVRQSLGITQEKMAETMDVSVRQYRRYEAGEASLPISFLDAAEAYGIDVNYIGTGKLLVDLQIELGMRCMPKEDFDAVICSISSCWHWSLWYLTPNSCNCRCIRVLQPDAHKRALLYDAACASAVCPRPTIPGSPA